MFFRDYSPGKLYTLFRENIKAPANTNHYRHRRNGKTRMQSVGIKETQVWLNTVPGYKTCASLSSRCCTESPDSVLFMFSRDYSPGNLYTLFRENIKVPADANQCRQQCNGKARMQSAGIKEAQVWLNTPGYKTCTSLSFRCCTESPDSVLFMFSRDYSPGKLYTYFRKILKFQPMLINAGSSVMARHGCNPQELKRHKSG